MASTVPNSEATQFKTGAKQVEIARLGGIASGKAKREYLNWKKAIEERMSVDDFNEIIDNMIKRAKDETKSAEVLRDTMGQKPVEVQQVIEAPQISDDINE